jgi:hypothetical protein
VNYYLGVLPEIDRRANAARFQAEINELEQRLPTAAQDTDALYPTLSETGHAVQFMNISPYFMNFSGATRATPSAASRSPAQRPQR